MKILKLHFKNINSLKGENQLDFNQAPLVNAGVFAITGPNGSGKSSILDAMTLALYGETFKFDRPAAHVMTRHTSECFAHIEFIVHSIHYRSRWHVQREQDDADAPVLPARMELSRLSAEGEEVLADDCAKVRARVAEIVGLDFRNFTRSTLLAQGDFSAFLNALDSERLDILEKIVSTDIYADYTQEMTRSAEQEQVKLAALQADLAAIPVLDNVTEEARGHDLADFKEQLSDFAQAVQELTQHMARLQTLADIDEHLEQAQRKQQALQQTLQQISADLQRIEAFKELSTLQTEVATVTNQQAILDEDDATLKRYQQELAHLQTQLDRLGNNAPDPERIAGTSISAQQERIADLTFQTEHLQATSSSEKVLIKTLENQLNEKQNDALAVKAWLDAHAQDASLLDGFPEIGPLKKLTLLISDLKRQQKSQLKSSKQSNKQLKSHQSSVQALHKEIPALQKNLVTYEAELSTLSSNHTLEELVELRAEQQERVNDFKELLALATIQNRFKDSLFVRLKLVQRPVDLDTAAINHQLAERKERLLTENTIKKALEHAVFNEALLRKMQADRIHLVDHEPCPLCGSLKHPFISQQPTVVDSKQTLLDQTARVQAINASIAKLQQQLQTAQKQQEGKQLKADRLTRVQAEWLTLCNRLNIAAQGLRIDEIKPIKKWLKTHLIELKDIDRLIKNVRDCQKKIAAITLQTETQTLTLSRVQGVIQELEHSHGNRPQELAELEQALAKNSAEEKHLSEKVSAQLTQLGEKFPSKGKEDALFDRLNQRRQTYQIYLLRDKQLLDDISALQQKISASQSDIAAYTQQLHDCSDKLQREQGSGLHLALIEKQKLINEKELKITQLKTQQHTLQQSLHAQASPFGIQSYAELTQLLQLLPQQAALLQQQQALDAQLQQQSLSLQNMLERKHAEQARVISDQSLADCEAEHKRLLEKIDIADLDVQHLEDLLAKQHALQEKYTLTLAKIAEQHARVEQANADLRQINAENRHVFRRKVQRKTADKLLAKTNLILEKISGRFYIRQGDNEQGLALEVEDTYQQNTRRLPKTLSGGESFVVSLALALGLSELASNGQSIESLFLDEGFGNLDAEALYTVVATLENLQTQGKKVGVISHVEGVRKRIKTQIEMLKKPNGLSELKLLV
jgi:exonuclease SbcC